MKTLRSKPLVRKFLPLTLLILTTLACGFIPTVPNIPIPVVPIQIPSPTSGPVQVSFTVTVPFWTSGDIYVGIGDNPTYLKLDAYNEVLYTGQVTLPLGAAYYYSRGSLETADSTSGRQITSGRVTDAVFGWKDDQRSIGRPGFEKGFFVAACDTCGVSITKGNFIEPMGRSMDAIKQDGGTWFSFMPNWFIVPDYQGNEIKPIYSNEFKGTSGWVTSTIQDADMVTLIGMAHDRGMKVYLCPALAPEDWGPGVKGKGDLQPSDPDLFFENYKAFIDHYADLAQQNGVEMLCVGSENDTLTEEDLSQNAGIDKTARWRDVIASARQHYQGLLTYSVSCISEERCGPQLIRFWDALDVIGWEWYVPIATGEHASIADMRKNAERIIANNIRPLYERYQKPIVITEMGWEAYPGACAHTYGTGSSKGGDRMEQASCYEAVFQALEGADFIQGVHIFTWTANLEGDEFRWVWTDPANEVRFTITEDMLAKWYHYFVTP
jgi:hypothetical protein